MKLAAGTAIAPAQARPPIATSAFRAPRRSSGGGLADGAPALAGTP
jgi:hypothetical protein